MKVIINKILSVIRANFHNFKSFYCQLSHVTQLTVEFFTASRICRAGKALQLCSTSTTINIGVVLCTGRPSHLTLLPKNWNVLQNLKEICNCVKLL